MLHQNHLTDTISINANNNTSTLAHELFHKIDKEYRMSNTIKDALDKDFKNISLNKQDIIKTVQRIDKNAFTYNAKGKTIFNEEYRGLADIINGYSRGEIKLGYSHSKTYWNKNKTIEKEAFAQFGRIYFENNSRVIKTIEQLLPATKQYIDIKLRKVSKKYV